MSQRVSIIMPVYNGERFLREAMESVLQQTYPHWELIVVDDGSTDGTADIIATFADPRIRYAYQTNHGQASALNHGLDLAQGDYVTTLDADDYMTADSLRVRVAYLARHADNDAVYGDGCYCDGALKPLALFSAYRTRNVTGDIYAVVLISSLFSAGSAVILRREKILRHTLRYDETIFWCQDWDFLIRAAEYMRFGYVNAITVYYRLHSSNMTLSSPSAKRRDSLLRTRKKMMHSARFEQLNATKRREFFYHVLVQELQGDVAEQDALLQSRQFRQLPATAQATLLRQMALNYLLQDQASPQTSAWLHESLALAPRDLKTMVMVAAVRLNATLARRIVGRWRAATQTAGPTVPLVLARNSQRVVN